MRKTIVGACLALALLPAPAAAQEDRRWRFMDGNVAGGVIMFIDERTREADGAIRRYWILSVYDPAVDVANYRNVDVGKVRYTADCDRRSTRAERVLFYSAARYLGEERIDGDFQQVATGTTEETILQYVCLGVSRDNESVPLVSEEGAIRTTRRFLASERARER